MPEKTLNYRSPREETRRWKPSSRQIFLGFLLLLGATVIGWIVLIGPTGAQFRLDTGDFRFTYFGVPGHTYRMEEPERSTILSLAAGSAVLTPEWVSAPYGQIPHVEASLKMLYRAARWAKTDPQVSKALLEDVARYQKGQHSPPINTIFDELLWFEPIGPGVWKPLDPAREKEAVNYLNSKGLPIPSTAPAATSPSTHPK